MRKFLPYIFILAILVGLLGPMASVNAQTGAPPRFGVEQCFDRSGTPISLNQIGTRDKCLTVENSNPPKPTGFTWRAATQADVDKSQASTEAADRGSDTEFENYVRKNGCGFGVTDKSSLYPGCFIAAAYGLFYVIPSLILWLSAHFFNVLISITLTSDLLSGSSFISSAWAVVRDISNIFFIIILLYVAIQTILGIGHETKKMIAKVVIMALLINFSMFITQVVIDTSNILALVFYSKLNVCTKTNPADKDCRPYKSVSGEKDVAGGMVNAFNPTRLLSADFFALAGEQRVPGQAPIPGPVSPGILIGMTVITGLIMLFAAYAFFISGISFMGRLIELWVLIIFSPFAFVSSSIPLLGKVEYIGWDSWLHRLFKVSFMAPIFMFFMYFIFLLVQVSPFQNIVTDNNKSLINTILLVLIPAFVILILLLKATKFAKEGSGKLGEVLMTGAKMAAGLAMGGGALGLAAVGRGTLGYLAKGASTGDTTNQRFKRGETKGTFDKLRGGALHYGTLGILTKAQEVAGKRLNADQKRVEHAAHARHELDTAASEVTHGNKKKWSDLNATEKFEAKRKMARDIAVRESQGNTPNPHTGLALGTRKWDALTDAERKIIYDRIGLDEHGDENDARGYNFTGDEVDEVNKTIKDAAQKQDLGSILKQAMISGSYDVRNLANVVAKEQSSGLSKLTMGLMGTVAMGLRGGFKSMGVGYGEGQKNFLKDLGNTVSEALKNAKINVDLSHVGDVKKEDDHGGGGGGHH